MYKQPQTSLKTIKHWTTNIFVNYFTYKRIKKYNFKRKQDLFCCLLCINYVQIGSTNNVQVS